jgi:hypothetical protein
MLAASSQPPAPPLPPEMSTATFVACYYKFQNLTSKFCKLEGSLGAKKMNKIDTVYQGWTKLSEYRNGRHRYETNFTENAFFILNLHVMFFFSLIK